MSSKESDKEPKVDDGSRKEENNHEDEIGVETRFANSEEFDDFVLEETSKKKIAYRDLPNILTLCGLYFLQGLPFGLVWSVPLILSSRKVSYADQGTFSFAAWPFALKILWAPLVDSFYIQRIGRRRTWVITCVFLSGLLMCSLSNYVNELLEPSRVRQSSDIYKLTFIFGTFVFLSATEDITLDGWSLELLLSKNTMWQPLCNGIGMGAGGFVGNALFLTLESEEFSNDYIRPFFGIPKKSGGVINIKTFMLLFGSIKLVASVLIFLFKSERNNKKLAIKSERLQMEALYKRIEEKTVSSAYKETIRLFRIKPMWKLIIVFITIRIGSATEGVMRLKLVEAGVAREKISLLNIFLSPFLFIFPFFLSHFIKGPRPLSSFIKVYPFKLIMVLIWTLFVFFTPFFSSERGKFSYWFYALYFFLGILNAAISYMYFVCIGAFQARICDKSIGGTYMTFTGLWLSVGRSLIGTPTLYLIDIFSKKNCIYSRNTKPLGLNNPMLANATSASVKTLKLVTKCTFNSDAQKCLKSGGICETVFDSFYILTVVFVFIGLLWIIFMTKYLRQLQSFPLSDWFVTNTKDKQKQLKEDENKEIDKTLEERVKMSTSMEIL